MYLFKLLNCLLTDFLVSLTFRQPFSPSLADSPLTFCKPWNLLGICCPHTVEFPTDLLEHLDQHESVPSGFLRRLRYRLSRQCRKVIRIHYFHPVYLQTDKPRYVTWPLHPSQSGETHFKQLPLVNICLKCQHHG